MATPQLRKQFHALCHEHHAPMRMIEILTKTEGPPTRTLAYACPQPDCGVHYAPQNGYFVLPKNGEAKLGMTPRVRCPRDGQPMYLAQTNPQKKAFRLWRCPQCHSNRTNEEDLVNEMA
jgi:hypothetical protein